MTPEREATVRDAGESARQRVPTATAGAIAADREAVGAADEQSARFQAFASAHHDRAFRLAYRLLGADRAAAEDVTQDAFLRAHRGLARFRGEAQLGTWFYRILVREVQRHRRWQKLRRVLRSEPLATAEELPARVQPPGDGALRQRIVAALARLTRRQCESFVLVHLEGFTVVETAALLGTSPGTVKTHLHRALASLRESLADLHGPESQGVAT